MLWQVGGASRFIRLQHAGSNPAHRVHTSSTLTKQVIIFPLISIGFAMTRFIYVVVIILGFELIGGLFLFLIPFVFLAKPLACSARNVFKILFSGKC